MAKNAKISLLWAALLLAVVGVALGRCTHRPAQWRQASGAVWNTTYNITYEASRDCSDSIQAVFRQVEMSLSPFAENSLISAINRNATDSTDALLRRVFAISQSVAAASGGKFDPTVSPVVNLWKFGYTGKVDTDSVWEPSAAQIDSALALVGIDGCRIDDAGKIHKKAPGTTFNFSAVTKGYACDLMAEMLQRNGARNVLVEIGGEIASRGVSSRGTPWRVQVDAPLTDSGVPQHEPLTYVELPESGAGVATSGNYRNYHGSSHGRVGHTIDPVTGRPVMTDLLSVTVIASDCATADAWATAAMASPTPTAAASLLRGAAANLRGASRNTTPAAASATALRAILVIADTLPPGYRLQCLP